MTPMMRIPPLLLLLLSLRLLFLPSQTRLATTFWLKHSFHSTMSWPRCCSEGFVNDVRGLLHSLQRDNSEDRVAESRRKGENSPPEAGHQGCKVITFQNFVSRLCSFLPISLPFRQTERPSRSLLKRSQKKTHSTKRITWSCWTCERRWNVSDAFTIPLLLP